MAQKPDMAAAKARKQKLILVIGGVVLLGLGAIQGPKLVKQLKGSGSGTAAPAAAPLTPSVPAGGSTSTPVAGQTTAGAAAVKPAAYLAGVALPSAARPAPGSSQLASFTLFESKDPFVPQVKEEGTGVSTPTSEPTLSDTQGAKGSTAGSGSKAGGGSASGGSGGASEPFTNVTMLFNGKPLQLQLKDTFPEADPTFVLVSVQKKEAKIGVAGGSFEDGRTMSIELGKRLTLVNTATGARFVLKLVYTGSQPERVESFSTAEQAAANGTK